MIKRLISLILPFIFTTLFLVNANADRCDEGSWNQIILDNKDFHYEAPFLEERNDIGIFFDFEWSSKLQKIIIKRNKDNYPIIRFSLFDKKNIKNGTIVKKINSFDLSLQSDEVLKSSFLESISETNFVEIELINGEKLSLESKPYKLNDFKLTNFELNSIQSIDSTKVLLKFLFNRILKIIGLIF